MQPFHPLFTSSLITYRFKHAQSAATALQDHILVDLYTQLTGGGVSANWFVFINEIIHTFFIFSFSAFVYCICILHIFFFFFKKDLFTLCLLASQLLYKAA
ncbi:hypothetical protein XENORESO_002288 [Xenotaenia resolanae]|uniref:Uncharacterized protein n=1 Tax=Xenotaenia resolanae TaxID=208358 RepID=A0ABV0VW01_9TELE